jgi:hypothetical protein
MGLLLFLTFMAVWPFHLYEETNEGRIPIPDNLLESKVDRNSVVWIEFDSEGIDTGWAIEVEAMVIHPDGSAEEVPLPFFGGIDREGNINKIALRSFQLRDTYLDLRRFGLREGDLIRLHFSDLRMGKFDAVRYIDVVRVGLRTGVSSVFLFPMRRTGSWEQGGPYGGATYYFDFNTRKRNFKEKFFNVVGFGLNFSILDFNKEKQTEIGIAPVFTIWGNVFQLGFGYNLSVNEDPYYFIVAFDLPQVFSILHLVSK